MKTCTKCNEVKPRDMFYRQAASKDGLQFSCKACAAAQSAAHYAVNRIAALAQCATWRAANPEKVAAAGATWRAANPEKYAAKSAAYRAANPEKIAAYKAAHRADNPEKYAARAATWRAANPERMAAKGANRRAEKLGADGTFTAAEWKALLEASGGTCTYCRATGKLQVDHVVPLSKGGTNWIDNITPACGPCNNAKGNGSAEAHRAYLAQVHAHLSAQDRELAAAKEREWLAAQQLWRS